jgi:hypothetical protein
MTGEQGRAIRIVNGHLEMAAINAAYPPEENVLDLWMRYEGDVDFQSEAFYPHT